MLRQRPQGAETIVMPCENSVPGDWQAVRSLCDELGRATTAYGVAAGFGELWLQPSGSVGLMGAAAAGTFVRGALDRAQVEPLFAQRYEYKNAADTFLRKEFTEAHREATERLAESAYEQVVSAVSVGRRLPADRVRELIDRAPIPAADAQEARLVDHLGYRDRSAER